jgi:hypothetical protein
MVSEINNAWFAMGANDLRFKMAVMGSESESMWNPPAAP